METTIYDKITSMKTGDNHGNISSNIKSVFNSKSAAIIGASTKSETVGHAIFSNMLFGRYKGIVYPVNPKAKSILGVKCYPNVSSIPDEIELAVVIVPANVVSSTLEECGQKGVKAAIVITAGFKEIGKDGIELEKQLIKVSKKYNIAVIGPNCLGVINTDPEISMNATFATSMPKCGNIGFISQSGALCTAVLDYAKGENIGFSKFISMGNKALINENDLLLFLKDDPQTSVIVLYLEDIVDGRSFINIAREITGEISKCKPIIAIKAGRTQLGAKAASSHTGSLAGSDEVYDAVFAQSGVFRVDSVEELFDLAIAFSTSPLPKGKRTAIITNAGGPGIITTDACIRYGLDLADFSPKTKEILKQKLPKTANINNPIDVIGDAQHDRYEVAFEAVFNDAGVDGVIALLSPQAITDIKEVAKIVSRFANKKEKPVLACFMGLVDVSEGVKVLEQNNVAHYMFPEASARVLSSMYKYTQWLVRKRTKPKEFKVDKEKVKQIFDKVKIENRNFLPEVEAIEVLRAYGFPMLKSKLTKDVNDCVKTANEIGYPVAMKIASSDIIHKFDVGGVRLGINNDEELKKEYKDMMDNVKKHMPNAKIWGVLIQEMCEKGVETIIGMKKDPHFGPLIMFGLGGIYVEVLKDVTFRVAPIRELGAMIMIESIKTHKILEGVRNTPKRDIKSIAECIQRLSQLVMDFDEINEFDINPLVVYEEGKGCRVADARISITDNRH